MASLSLPLLQCLCDVVEALQSPLHSGILSEYLPPRMLKLYDVQVSKYNAMLNPSLRISDFGES